MNTPPDARQDPTRPDLEAIEARANKATAAPWVRGSWNGRCLEKHKHGLGVCNYLYRLDVYDYYGRFVSGACPIEIIGINENGQILSLENADFIANARQDVPALVAYARHLEAEVERLRFQSERLFNSASELVEVANLRGDNELPHPADDPKSWTARMQDAWDEIANAVDEFPAPEERKDK